MVDDFHRNGVHVLSPVMMWDQGTRAQGEPEWTALSRELASVGADGITQTRSTGCRAVSHGVGRGSSSTGA